MNFLEWKVLNERMTAVQLKKASAEAVEFFSDFGYKYMVPDFEFFKRQGEPFQQAMLFTDQKLRTFMLNFTQDGKLFSVDFWKPNSVEPVRTLYAEGVPTIDIIEIVPEIAKDPEKKLDLKVLRAKKRVMNESAGNDPKLVNSKPSVEADPDVKKAEKRMMDEYDYSDPETIFDDLERYVKMVIDGIQPSLVLTGSPGVGKTYLVLSQLKEAGLKDEKDYVHVKGRSTAAGMYTTLYQNRDKIVVFDDCDSVFSTPDALNILKGALDSYGERKISWLTAKPLKADDNTNIPKSFIFDGGVIFISNLPQRKIDDAIKTRSFVLEVALTPEDMLKRMKDQLPNIMKEVPLPIREEALDFIESISGKTDNLELNMRTLIKAVKILQSVDELEIAQRLIAQQCSYK
jgi:hypothetical protein